MIDKSPTMGFLFAYLLGGITFPFILIGAVLVFAYWSFPDAHGQFLEEPGLREDDDDDEIFKSEESMAIYYRKSTKADPDVAAGYFAVTREYVPGGINGRPPERPSPSASTPPESPSVYQSMYRSIFDRKANASTPSVSSNLKGKNVFFVAMR